MNIYFIIERLSCKKCGLLNDLVKCRTDFGDFNLCYICFGEKEDEMISKKLEDMLKEKYTYENQSIILSYKETKDKYMELKFWIVHNAIRPISITWRRSKKNIINGRELV